MKFGLQINRFDWAGAPDSIGPKLADIARTAEAAGFDSIWVMDHYYQIEPGLGRKEDPMLEAYSALTYIAAVTETVKLELCCAAGISHYKPDGRHRKKEEDGQIRVPNEIHAGWEDSPH